MRYMMAGCFALLGVLVPDLGLTGYRVSASPSPIERPVVFTSGSDRVYGTFEVPAQAAGHRLPGMLLLAGSGATDRNGNEPALRLTHMDTLRHFANALAAAGVATLRFDKFGTGRTGITGHPNPAAVGFNLYVREARSAYNYLATRPAIDARRLAILGHSEGGLIALILGNQLVRAPTPRALVLAAPPGLPILETIREQEGPALAAAVQRGGLSQEQADAALAELDRIIAQIKQQGTIPTNIQTPGWKFIFSPVNTRFLVQDESYDPQVLASRLPRTISVLVLHGKLDVQVSESDMRGLWTVLHRTGHTRAMLYDLPQVDHVFKQVPGVPSANPLVDYNNPTLPFSPAATRRLKAFVIRYLAQ